MYTPGRVVSVEKRFKKWMARIAVDLDGQVDNRSFFIEFDHEPTAQELAAATQRKCDHLNNPPQDEDGGDAIPD